MRKKLTKEAKAYEAKLLAYSWKVAPGTYLLHLPNVSLLAYVSGPLYSTRHKELLLGFSAVRAIVPEYKRGGYWDGDLLIRLMREGEATIRQVFRPFSEEFIRNGIKVTVRCEDSLLYVATPMGHFVVEPYDRKIYEYDREPDFSLLNSLRNVELWQQALERAGL